MKQLRSRLSLLAVTLALITIPATSAYADHTHPVPPIGHWGNGYAPEVVIDNSTGNSHLGNVQDAAGYWQDTGFINGFRIQFAPSNDGCAIKLGAIKVCELNVFDARLQNREGITLSTWICDLPSCTNDQVHLYYARVYIRAGLSDYRRQQVYRHEFGHAIGLGHTLDPNCVMRSDSDVYNGTRCQHDIDSIRDLYIYHRTG